jgi:kinesin family protein 2/24
MYHSAERRREGAEINASLHALKECIRARALQQQMRRQQEQCHVHVPFRTSALTKVLMESFERSDALLSMIATLSPTPTDTEHSLATLKTVQMISGIDGADCSFEEHQTVERDMPGRGAARGQEREVVAVPSKWNPEQVRQWISKVKGGKFQQYAQGLPGHIDGKVFCRWGQIKFNELCGGRSELGLVLFNALRNEVGRVSQAKQQAAVQARRVRKSDHC